MVFDEATSSLDSKTEKDILSALEVAAKGKTTLVVAHRLSTIISADEIIVLKHGVIAERGTHQQLVARDGAYAALYRKQLLEEELAAS